MEMRQIGVRDEAKLLADFGDCGKETCCNSHLIDIPPVSMRMARLQRTTLDPNKISGRCGRLKCCCATNSILRTTGIVAAGSGRRRFRYGRRPPGNRRLRAMSGSCALEPDFAKLLKEDRRYPNWPGFGVSIVSPTGSRPSVAVSAM